MLEDVNNLSVTVNGQSKVPPGFRFHPTEEELLHYYLTKKVASQKIDLDVIREIDLNKLEPWDIKETCKIGSSSTPQNEWYLFSHKDKKYPTGTRTNRATAAGFWKATGRDKVIHNCSFSRIEMRKTLVFYRGRAPHGLKSDWIMHEYRLIHNNEKENNMSNIAITITNPNSSSHYSGDQSDQGWVVCRVFKKKNYHKKSTDHHSRLSMITSRSKEEGNMMLDHILTSSNSSSSSCKQENDEFNNNSTPLMFSNNLLIPSTTPAGNFMHLPGLECRDEGLLISEIGPCSDWAAVDRLVASQLNGQPTNDEARLLHDTMMMMMMMNSSSDYDHLHDVPNSSLLDHFGQSSLSSSDPLSRFSI